VILNAKGYNLWMDMDFPWIMVESIQKDFFMAAAVNLQTHLGKHPSKMEIDGFWMTVPFWTFDQNGRLIRGTGTKSVWINMKTFHAELDKMMVKYLVEGYSFTDIILDWFYNNIDRDLPKGLQYLEDFKLPEDL
jgi:hypothetical protein